MSEGILKKIVILSGGGAIILGLLSFKEFREKKDVQSSLQKFEQKNNQNKSWKKFNVKTKTNYRRPAQVMQKNLPSSSSETDRQINSMTNRLLAIENCYIEPEKCSLPKTDPKSEFFSVGKKLKTGLNSLFKLTLEDNLKRKDLEKIARHFLKVPDGHVKEAALHLLSTQEKNEMNMEAILKEIINYHDARLIEHAMLELHYYLTDPDQAHRVHTSLATAMKTGSIFVSQEISRHLQPFINNNSMALYSETAKNLSLGSATRKYIENALREYRLSLDAA